MKTTTVSFPPRCIVILRHARTLFLKRASKEDLIVRVRGAESAGGLRRTSGSPVHPRQENCVHQGPSRGERQIHSYRGRTVNTAWKTNVLYQ
ncbi:hypothetical protein RRG08_002188 [Elysia crispata]|uniref:Uncharacterized protein n=1 Tax=Elysia crispata TaxID=231223 RepID=A0AAE1DCS6_9GAST|nr:hypothetical protein RRG08_002188 [Elysia crispata]